MSSSLLIHGGPILTMNPAQPRVEAVGIAQGRVAAAGALDHVRAELGTRVEDIDLRGRTATPGLYDAHAHVMGVGFAASDVDISSNAVTSIADIRRAVRERAGETTPGGWVIGRGYDQALLSEQRHPTRFDLDEAAPETPVALWRTCHHIMVANSTALELAGITRNTPDPSDGTIDRDEHGEPTGVLRESATGAVTNAIGLASEDEIAAALEIGGNAFRQYGITSVAEAGIRRPEELRAYQRLRANGTLALRTWLMMIIDETLDELIALGIRSGFGDEWLRIGNAKLFSDGSIGGRTARMSRPYEGEIDNYGLLMIPVEEIAEKVLRAHTAGFQLGIHAIGDAAIGHVLDAYEAAQRAVPREDPRFRIEHCSILDEGLLDRMQRLGAVPIPGTTFLHDMRPVYLQNLGRERVRYAYAMRTFADRGIIAAASSDAPVSTQNPMVGIQTMVTRKDRLGDEIFPEERVSLEEAIAAYTTHGAYASFAEHEKGMLAPGMLADVAIFETDLSQVAPDELGNVRCDMTIADGAVVYERAAAPVA
ncbi:MAG TPA: amidohydrolase [Thermomicrobiales bacterium]|nr:amidohydrolase [Thermomicrobiales bacterium]